MKLVFNQSIPTILMILIIAFFLIYAFLVIWKNKDKWITYLLLVFIRGLTLSFILLFFFKPATQEIVTKKVNTPIPVFIDNSFSMLQDIYLKKKNKWMPKNLYYRRLLERNFLNSKDTKKKNQFDFYLFHNQIKKITLKKKKAKKNNKIKRYLKLDQPYGIFDINQWLKTLKETPNIAASSVILISDLNNRFDEKLLQRLNKKIYVLYKKELTYDVSIREVKKTSKENKKGYDLELKVHKHGKQPRDITITLYLQDKNIYQDNYTLTETKTVINIALNKSYKRDKIIRAEIDNKREESNKLNNRYFFKLKGLEKDKKIHLLFQKPSYELSFLKKFLRKQNRYKIKLYMPTPVKGPIKLPDSIPTRDIVIVGDFDKMKPAHARYLGQFVHKGGLLIFLKGNSNLKKLMKGKKWAALMPFYYAVKDKAGKEKSQNRKNADGVKETIPLSITKKGKKYSFLSFREPEPEEIWKDLPFFNPLVKEIRKKEKASVLAVGEASQDIALITQSYGKGIVMAILADPLWSLDFSNLGFGVRSNYYDQFWQELLKLNDLKDPETKILLLKEIYKFGKKAFIYYPQDGGITTETELMLSGSKGSQPLKILNKNGLLMSEVKCEQLGQNKIIHLEEDKQLGAFYVNYPNKESLQSKSEKRNDRAQLIATETKGEVIRIKDLKKISTDASFLRQKENSYKEIKETSIIHHYLYMVLIMMLFTLEWGIRRVILGI